MTELEQAIARWRKRRETREAKAKRSRRDTREARRDRNEIKRDLKRKRTERDNLRRELELVHARRNVDQIRAELERNERQRRALARELLEANRELDEAREQLRAALARVARAAKRLQHLEHKAAGQRGRVITRAEWGAAAPRGGYTPQTAIVAGVQHHTANPALPANATVAQEAARMRQIQAGHFARGFTDIGYEEVVFPSGRRYQGRPQSAVGAHTLGHNTGYAGKSYDANTDVNPLTPAAEAALRDSWRPRIGTKRLFGHYQLNPTACPGRDLKAKLGRLN